MNLTAAHLVIRIVRTNPGLDIDALVQKISMSVAPPNVIFHLLYCDNFQLKRLLDERLPCVEFRDGGYYFILNPERYHYFDSVDYSLRKIFMQEERAMADKVKRRKSKPSGD
jgi:hypothetical protein